jgi:regulator of sigma E protease
VFVLGFLVLIHEIGHFVTAKLFKIRVERFSIGYPPRLFGHKFGETDYCVSAVPFGGYVKIAGMVDESLDKKSLAGPPKPWEFRSKPWIAKTAVIAAGSLANIAFAWAFFVGVTLWLGIYEAKDPVVGSIAEGQPAAAAGIKPGDRIVSLDGKPVSTWEDIAGVIHGSPEKPVTVVWARSDSSFSAVVVPIRDKLAEGSEMREKGLIGIGPELTARKVGLVSAVVYGSRNLAGFTGLIVSSLAKLITGQESIRSLAGPVFIAKLAGESARSGFASLLGFMAFLSLNLGLLNLLPFPVLDGGHLVIIGVEGIIRREIPVKVKMAIQQVGVVLLVGLMVFVIFNDVSRIIKK